MNSNSFQRRCVYFSRGTLTFCSQTNLNIRSNPCRGGGGGDRGNWSVMREANPFRKAWYSGYSHAFFLFFFFFFLANLGSSVRMYPYVSRMYSYATRMYPYVSRMLLVCYPYVLVCTRMLLVCRSELRNSLLSYVTRMFSYVPVCHSYVTRVVY